MGYVLGVQILVYVMRCMLVYIDFFFFGQYISQATLRQKIGVRLVYLMI